MKAGIKAALSAGIEVVLKAGASSLVLNPAGVFVNGPVINLTGGGMAGAAVGASPQVPTVAARIGGVKAVKELNQSHAKFSSAPPSISFQGLIRQRHTLLNAARTAIGLVKICEQPSAEH